MTERTRRLQIVQLKILAVSITEKLHTDAFYHAAKEQWAAVISRRNNPTWYFDHVETLIYRYGVQGVDPNIRRQA